MKLRSVNKINPLVLSTLFIEHFKEEICLENSWTSFGHRISREDGKHKVVLEDLFEVHKDQVIKVKGAAGQIPNLNEVFFLTCMQFRLYNYTGLEYNDYIKELRTRMKNLGKNQPFNVNGLNNLLKYEGVTEDENLHRIIAGLDMFLMQANNSKFKLLRMGTVCMRLKDMGAWSAIRSMYSYAGDDARKHDAIFRWFFSEGVREELQNLIEETQETDKENSYYPYARSMNLIRSTFASVANNPNLHLIVQGPKKEQHLKSAFGLQWD